MSAAVKATATFVLLLGASYCVAVLKRWVVYGASPGTWWLPYAEGRALLHQHASVPSGADRLLFASAPWIAIVTVALAALVVPLGPALVAFDPSIGLFYFIVVLGPFVVAMFSAGWSQNSKAGLFGAFRAAAVLLAYEVPLGFAAIGPVMDAGSLSTVRIVDAQTSLWYGAWQPLGVAIYLVAALMMSYTHPFDIPQADDIEGGVLAEYAGERLLLFRIALDALFALLMAMGVVLFLGGGSGPLLPAPLWFVVKTVALAGVTLFVARRVPRLRHDQMLSLSWKILLPASLVNVGIVGVLVLVR